MEELELIFTFVKNELIIRIKYYLLIIFAKICSVFNITIYYENEIGIKNINKKSIRKDRYIVKSSVQINPCDLFIGFDGMKDQYTLVDTPINLSPHFEFMKCLNDNGDKKILSITI